MLSGCAGLVSEQADQRATPAWNKAASGNQTAETRKMAERPQQTRNRKRRRPVRLLAFKRPAGECSVRANPGKFDAPGKIAT